MRNRRRVEGGGRGGGMTPRLSICLSHRRIVQAILVNKWEQGIGSYSLEASRSSSASLLSSDGLRELATFALSYRVLWEDFGCCFDVE
jgi:hypothetical protein